MQGEMNTGREATKLATDGHLKTLRNLEAAVDFLSRHQIYDDEIVAVTGTPHMANLHLHPAATRRIGVDVEMKCESGFAHYHGTVDGVRLTTIDYGRFVKEEAEKV